jgi:outer membrane protein OmpA-like peptidoglycan-associated protein
MHNKNAGAQLLLTKRIGNNWRIRGVVEVNGFIRNKFDRLGKGMLGISFDLLPFYVYADYGANLNPSEKSKFGLAMDGGIGLQFNVGNTASLYVEGGVDRTNNGTKWQSNAEVKAGVLVNTGITEQDRVNKSITDNMRSEYGELKGENKLLKSALEKAQKTNEEQNTTLSESIALLNEMREQLNSCKQERKEIEENCKKGLQVIYFDFGSAMISDVMDDLIADAADIILNDNNDYRIEGYCSANGSDYTNQILSERRANAVYQRLVLYGVPEYRLYTQGNGMTEIDRASEQRVIIVKIEK